MKDLGLWDCSFLQIWTIGTFLHSKKHIFLGTPILCVCLFSCDVFGKINFLLLACSDWIKSCIDLWDSIPNCQFWNSQWAALLARVIKNCNFIDWECFLPTLFARYLNMFEVGVSHSSKDDVSYSCFIVHALCTIWSSVLIKISLLSIKKKLLYSYIFYVNFVVDNQN